MRILFSVNGIGIGQATRSLAVYRELKENTLFVSYEDGYKFLKDKVKTKKVDWFNFVGKHSLDIISTTWNMLRNVDIHFRAIERMRKIFIEFKPDVVISDHDLVSLDVAEEFGIPSFSILTLYTVKNNYKYIPKELKSNSIKLQKKAVDFIIRTFERRSNVVFYPSFDVSYKYREKVKVTDLIVREKRKITKGNLIYVSLGGTKLEKSFLRPLVNSLKKIDEYKFLIAGGRRRSLKNVEIFPFVNPFDYLKKSKAVITTAGHSSISEALVYKKPVLTIPLLNHVEQLSNAIAVKRMGCGDYLLIKDLRKNYSEKILSFLKKIEIYERNVENLRFNGNGAKEIASYILSSIS